MGTLAPEFRPATRAGLAAVIIVLAGLAAVVPTSHPTSPAAATYPLFQGTYTTSNFTLSNVSGNRMASLERFIVGGSYYYIAYLTTPNDDFLIGYVLDGDGFQFAFNLYAPGGFDLSNSSTTWGSPDGNSEVWWSHANGSIAEFEIATRDNPWQVTFESAPAPQGCEQSSSVSFGGANWTTELSACGSPGGVAESWTAITAGDQNFTVGFGGPELTICGVARVYLSAQAFPASGVECMGWFDPYATLGLVLSDQGPLMLSMN